MGLTNLLLEEISKVSGLKVEIINSLVYRNKPRYRVFLIKSESKYRKIKTPIPSLKIVQKAISQILKNKIQVHESAHAYVAGKSILTHAAIHLNQKAYFKSDISDCFGSIKSPIIRGIFIEAGYKAADAFIGTSLVTDNNTLPQGSPSSPLICNLALRGVDRSFLGLANKINAKYSRYGDDIVISGENFDYEILTLAKTIFDKFDFIMNMKKTYYSFEPKQNIITGLSISSGTMRVRKCFKRLTRQEAHFLIKNGILNFSANGDVFDPFAIDRVIGKLQWWSHVEKDAVFPKEKLKIIYRLLSEQKN